MEEGRSNFGHNVMIKCPLSIILLSIFFHVIFSENNQRTNQLGQRGKLTKKSGKNILKN